MLSSLRSHLRCFKAALSSLLSDNVSTHSAALAFYAIFSIAPILIISIAVAGVFFGEQASHGEIFTAISKMLGSAGAHAVERLVLDASRRRGSGKTAEILGIATLFFGASGAFQQMEQSLNSIWRVEARPESGIWMLIRRRLMSFSLVLVIGFLLLVSLVASAAIAAVGSFLGNILPGGEVFWHLANFAITFGIITVLFAAIFKILPDVSVRWGDVWFGGGVTAFLFGVGKFAIGLYLGKSTVASSYGAAGSLVVILLWVYYSSYILYFGAELTRVYATRDGRSVLPRSGARYEPRKEAA